MKIAVCGPQAYASWRARGKGLAAAHTWHVLDCQKTIPQKYDVIWLVKRRIGKPLAENLRASCERLIFDPLDYWPSPASADPITCWKALWDKLRFDDLIATSPASQEAMQQGLQGLPVNVHLLPHQCDARIQPDWHDPHGPIVYAGSQCFLGTFQPVIAEAVRLLGRELRLDFRQHHAWKSLEGAALQLCLRLPPHDTPWNRFHRPQIKLENSAAGGIPLVYTGQDCEISLHAGHEVMDPKRHATAADLALVLEKALCSEPPLNCYRPETFYEQAAQIALS